ncbi:hypothetical protein [Devosia riboflavina]|uniref:hypothetical protein n=1 Tax=Devosia riboflavina TaxID=46914 RepID=UPI00069125B0|nr:hypothetical protein [Devosia riboflavina]
MPGPPKKPDLTYSCPDGIWTRFYPETAAGEDAWRVMAAADPQGVVAFLPGQVPGVIAQLKAAGLIVGKAKPIKPGDLDAILNELDG